MAAVDERAALAGPAPAHMPVTASAAQAPADASAAEEILPFRRIQLSPVAAVERSNRRVTAPLRAIA